MKITNYGPSGLNPYKREFQKAETVKKSVGKTNDQIEISSEALKLQQKSDPARQAKIAEIKEQVQNGTYKIDHQELAKSIYNYYMKKQ
ncbi:flagellar biosynthesis anti-sigma factor FlgM [Bacillus andreraoultii]|uniref:flagellar biosynthesis anti-sigma factor FlgM n=1 Tax=Bacillus andreraoultii TaxID=1499685 RepID=UPI000539AF5A|nr:flagellar biosynthesis anti-sigma factor FlgM [Bacillus andreraoultii]